MALPDAARCRAPNILAKGCSCRAERRAGQEFWTPLTAALTVPVDPADTNGCEWRRSCQKTALEKCQGKCSKRAGMLLVLQELTDPVLCSKAFQGQHIPASATGPWAQGQGLLWAHRDHRILCTHLMEARKPRGACTVKPASCVMAVTEKKISKQTSLLFSSMFLTGVTQISLKNPWNSMDDNILMSHL